MSLLRRIARPMLASLFIAGGVDRLRHPSSKAEAAGPMVRALAGATGQPADVELAVRANGTAMVLGGALLGTSLAPRLGATLLAGALVPATLAEHPFGDVENDTERRAQRHQFLTNLSLLGGLLLATVDTDGRPGLRYRAGMVSDQVGRSVAGTRKDARTAAKVARLETKLAALRARNALS